MAVLTKIRLVTPRLQHARGTVCHKQPIEAVRFFV